MEPCGFVFTVTVCEVAIEEQRPYELRVIKVTVYTPGLVKLNCGCAEVALVLFAYVYAGVLGVQLELLE